MSSGLQRQLLDLLRDPVQASGADLEAVAVRRAGARLLVQITVDTDGGISLDQVAELSRTIGALLDDTDLLGTGPYVLEVGSPGVSRPLTEPRHWRRNTGRLVRATLRTDAGSETLEGRISACEDDHVVLALADGPRPVAFADVQRAVVQAELNRAGDDHGH